MAMAEIKERILYLEKKYSAVIYENIKIIIQFIEGNSHKFTKEPSKIYRRDKNQLNDRNRAGRDICKTEYQ